jgi:hypothetical protein
MDLLNLIFRLGVVIAIFGFLFGLFEIGLSILRGIRPKTLFEEYTIKAIKYIFLGNVSFLFCYDISGAQLSVYNGVLTALILAIYFIGKIQNQQQRLVMFQMMGNALSQPKKIFNFKAEILIILIALAVFGGLFFFPELASNNASLWFHESIVDIEDTPVFGFIFKVIGFFFMLTILVRLFSSFTFLLSGNAFAKRNESSQKQDDNKFDDYEEIE